MYETDAAITGWINGWAGLSPAGDSLMIWISTIGVPLMVLAVALQWWLPKRDLPTRHVLVASGLTFLIGLGINQLVLLFIQRARPYEAHVSRLIIEPTADFSFPSDHATASFAIAAAFLLLGQRGRGAAFLAAAVIISLSRVYLGTHYVSDIIGGAATAVIAALLVRAAYRENTVLDRFVTGIL